MNSQTTEREPRCTSPHRVAIPNEPDEAITDRLTTGASSPVSSATAPHDQAHHAVIRCGQIEVEHTIVHPTFVRDFPVETSPLTRQHPDEPLLTEK
ncbi:hypothetical protein [Saccharopolyspora hattusasensis]|uniref:hypothetical protein n=1 Tax=Saccharopolyspora hattusasensis TaxID=1128679 RepID=UPI003D993161